MKKGIVVLLCLFLAAFVSAAFATDTPDTKADQAQASDRSTVEVAKQLPSTLMTGEEQQQTGLNSAAENPWAAQYATIPSDID